MALENGSNIHLEEQKEKKQTAVRKNLGRQPTNISRHFKVIVIKKRQY